LVCNAQGSLDKEVGSNSAIGEDGLPLIQNGIIEEALRSEDANLAAAEQVVEHRGALAQSAAAAVACQTHVLEAGEEAALQTGGEAVHEADIELPFSLV